MVRRDDKDLGEFEEHSRPDDDDVIFPSRPGFSYYYCPSSPLPPSAPFISRSRGHVSRHASAWPGRLEEALNVYHDFRSDDAWWIVY